MVSRYFEHYSPTCDCCGKPLPAERDDEAAEAAMKAAGWEKRGDTDICTTCLRKEKETGALPGRQLFWKYTEHLRRKRQ